MMPCNKIFLASGSVQRRMLLKHLGYPFEVLSSTILEERASGEKPEDYVCRLAQEKAEAGLALLKTPSPVLGADTIVLLEEDVLEKPRGKEEACQMLTRLSGRMHQVYTAVALAYPDYRDLRLVTTKVSFCRLNTDEIEQYWNTGEPEGKSGAYAIQGCGGKFITRIEGSYSGVVGLPLLETDLLIKAWQTKFVETKFVETKFVETKCVENQPVANKSIENNPAENQQKEDGSVDTGDLHDL